MAVCFKAEDVDSDATPERPTTKSANKEATFAEFLVPRGSPGSLSSDRHIVIVMDALKPFSWGPLQWTLDHAIPCNCTVTLLGVMPWIPLACKIVNFFLSSFIEKSADEHVFIVFMLSFDA